MIPKSDWENFRLDVSCFYILNEALMLFGSAFIEKYILRIISNNCFLFEILWNLRMSYVKHKIIDFLRYYC